MHDLQFFISSNSHRPIENWVTLNCGAKFIHACPRVPLVEVITKDGKSVVLLGRALQLEPKLPSPLEILQNSILTDISQNTYTWSGRWVLIHDNELYLDAGGTLSVFYSTAEPYEISSSLEILAARRNLIRDRNTQLIHSAGIDWHVSPSTNTRGLKRLLPSQTINIESCAMRIRPSFSIMTHGNLIEKYQQALVHGLTHLAKSFPKLYLPLTAGLDSRTILAALTAAGIKPITYTFDKDGISQADKHLPSKLAARLGLQHRLVSPKQYDAEKAFAFDKHTHGDCVDIDRQYYAYGQWDNFDMNGLILRGGCFEFGRNFYDVKLPAEMPDNAEAFFKYLTPKLLRWGNCTSTVAGLSDWLEWIKKSPQTNLDYRDRFYLEQRLGGWLASIEQALDLTGTHRLHIANSAFLYDLMNQVPRDQRAAGQFQKSIISNLAPALAEYPYNSPDPSFEKLRKRAIRIAGILLKKIRLGINSRA